MTSVRQHTRIGNYDYKHRLESRHDKGIEDLLERREKREEEHKRKDVGRLLRRSGHYSMEEAERVKPGITKYLEGQIVHTDSDTPGYNPRDKKIYIGPQHSTLNLLHEFAHKRTDEEHGIKPLDDDDDDDEYEDVPIEEQEEIIRDYKKNYPYAKKVAKKHKITKHGVYKLAREGPKKGLKRATGSELAAHKFARRMQKKLEEDD